MNWWTEGLAEYFARGDYYIDASERLTAKTYQLSEIFPDSWEFLKNYTYGYAAVKFLKEDFFNIVEGLLQRLRNGSVDYTERVRAYNSRIEAIGTSLDVNFHNWIDDLVSKWAEEGDPVLEGYCYSEPFGDDYTSYISQVSLAGRTIADYRNKLYSFQNEVAPIDINSGSSYDLDITVGSEKDTDDNTYYVQAWIDWNKDKEFSGDTEKVIDQRVSLSSPDELYTISQT